ncbi:ATP-binding protein, partial [Candidatus Omnitrophota bacterium]
SLSKRIFQRLGKVLRLLFFAGITAGSILLLSEVAFAQDVVPQGIQFSFGTVLSIVAGVALAAVVLGAIVLALLRTSGYRISGNEKVRRWLGRLKMFDFIWSLVVILAAVFILLFFKPALGNPGLDEQVSFVTAFLESHYVPITFLGIGGILAAVSWLLRTISCRSSYCSIKTRPLPHDVHSQRLQIAIRGLKTSIVSGLPQKINTIRLHLSNQLKRFRKEGNKEAIAQIQDLIDELDVLRVEYKALLASVIRYTPSPEARTLWKNSWLSLRAGLRGRTFEPDVSKPGPRDRAELRVAISKHTISANPELREYLQKSLTELQERTEECLQRFKKIVRSTRFNRGVARGVIVIFEKMLASVTASIEFSQGHIHREVIDANAFLRTELQGHYEKYFRRRNREQAITFNLSGEPLYICCNPVLFAVAVENIIENGLQATHTKRKGIGKVSVMSKKAGNDARVVIADNGVGIEQNKLGDIFQFGFSLTPGSRGLGLTQAQYIIKDDHRGTILPSSSVTSKTVHGDLVGSEGSSFTITIPSVSALGIFCLNLKPSFHRLHDLKVLSWKLRFVALLGIVLTLLIPLFAFGFIILGFVALVAPELLTTILDFLGPLHSYFLEQASTAAMFVNEGPLHLEALTSSVAGGGASFFSAAALIDYYSSDGVEITVAGAVIVNFKGSKLREIELYMTPAQLYQRWQKMFTDKADTMISLFGEAALSNFWARDFIERLAYIAFDELDFSSSKRTWRYLHDIIEPNLWLSTATENRLMAYSPEIYEGVEHHVETISYVQLPDVFLREVLRNRVVPTELATAYALYEYAQETKRKTGRAPDYMSVFASLRDQKKLRVPRGDYRVMLNVFAFLPEEAQSKAIPALKDKAGSLQVHAHEASYGFYRIIITSDDQDFIHGVEKIAGRQERFAGREGLPQPVFCLKVKPIIGKDGIRRLWVAEFQPVVRLYYDHPGELKAFMAQVEAFALRILQHYPEMLVDNFGNQPFERIAFPTTGYVISIPFATFTTAMRYYTYFPLAAGMKLVPLARPHLDEDTIYWHSLNFVWELPVIRDDISSPQESAPEAGVSMFTSFGGFEGMLGALAGGTPLTQFKRAVVALGGNAFREEGQSRKTCGDEIDTIEQANIDGFASAIAEGLLETGYIPAALVHGNGPLVGELLDQNPELSVGTADAASQFDYGAKIRRAFIKVESSLESVVGYLLSYVAVAEDSLEKDPSKPIGPWLSREEKDEMERLHPGRVYRELRDNNNGKNWRWVVLSPEPIAIIGAEKIIEMVEAGIIPICGGGGGIPVVQEGNVLTTVEGVIDKDLVAQILAKTIGAELLVILTNVARANINHGTNAEAGLGIITVSEARRYVKEGHFGKGSMLEKMLAGIRHIEAGG